MSATGTVPLTRIAFWAEIMLNNMVKKKSVSRKGLRSAKYYFVLRLKRDPMIKYPYMFEEYSPGNSTSTNYN